MTHFIGAVIAPSNLGGVTLAKTKWPTIYDKDANEVIPSEDLKQYLDKTLSPFDEGMEVDEYTDGYGELTTYNPESRWDWWVIGGRWEDHYRERQGETVSNLLMRVSQLRIAVTDEELKNRLQRAEQRWHEKLKTWRELRSSPEESLRARASEAEEEAEAAWADLTAEPAFVSSWFPYAMVIPGASATDDLELSQPTWIEKGTMGWWGSHYDRVDDAGWLEQLEAALRGVDPGFRVWYLDFHI